MSSHPSRIGPYRVLRPIASGGMAEVFEVADEASGEHLALKLLVQTGGALPRFNREYEAMIRLNHPNIVRVYHYGLHEGAPWLTMELIQGTQIQAYAKKLGKAGSQKRNDEILRLAHDLALALDHIHTRGLVHRDLKSANVLVLSDGRVKLLDFGTAKVSAAMDDITRDGEFLGTFAYASPEQIQGKVVDHRADLYSFGVLLYRLATGKMPFESEDVQKLARMQLKQAPRPPRDLASIDPGLDKVILSLLEKKPENRPQSGAAVAAILEEVAGHPLILPGTLDIDLTSEGIVGREEQLTVLLEFLDRAGDPAQLQPGAMSMVVGPPGCGRNRVMDGVERDCLARRWRVLSWVVTEGPDELEGLHKGLVELGRTFAYGSSPGVRTALGDLEASAATGITLAERLDAMRTAGATLLSARANADQRPVVVLVRGLELASPVGIEALVGLREAVERAGAAVVVLADCADTADEPFSAIRKRFPTAERVVLPPLTVREIALLVGAMLHRRPPPNAVARQIFQASGGQPGYVEEVVRGLVEEGILRIQSRDVNRIEWAQREERPIDVPPVARKRVIEQLARLPADRRRMLEVLALSGGEGTVNVIAGALQCTPDEIEPAIEDLVGHGWISVDRTELVPYARWRQFLAEAVVLDQLHPARRRVIEARLAVLLSNEPAFVAQIRLLLRTGRVDDALTRALDWGAHHLGKDRPSTALEVLDLVVPFLTVPGVTSSAKPGSTPTGAPTIFDSMRAQLALMHAGATLLARPTDPQIMRSLVLSQKLGRGDEGLFEAEVQLMRAQVARVIGHFPSFRKHLREAWNLVEHAGPSPLSATVADLFGWSNRVEGLVDESAAWHGRARRIATQLKDPVIRARADVGVAGWQLANGLLYEAERTTVAAIGVLHESGDTQGLSLAIPIWADSLRRQGRFSEVFDVLNQQIPIMRAAEVSTYYVRLLVAAAWCEVDICRLGRAQECVDELGAILSRGEHLDLRLQSELVWGRILLESGQYDEARAKLLATRDRARAAGLGVIAESAYALVGEVLWAAGEHKSAREVYRSAIAALEVSKDVPALADAVSSRAKVMAEHEPPDVLFAPIAEYLEEQQSHVSRLEREIASLRYQRATGGDRAAALRSAEAALKRIIDQPSATDSAAVRLHPWSREIRQAQKD